jgi:hypothetical protein
MGMKALHPSARSSYSAAWCRTFVAKRHQAFTQLCVTLVELIQHKIPEFGFNPIHATLGLEAADRAVQSGIYEPKECRHGRAIVEQGLVFNNHWGTRKISHDDPTTSSQWPPDHLNDLFAVSLLEGKPLTHFQNSSVESTRSKKPWP